MTKRRLAALAGVLVLITWLGTSSTLSAFLARVVNTTNRVSSAVLDCTQVPLADGATRHYPLNEGAGGVIAYDASSTGADGTYQGGRNSNAANPYPCARPVDWYARVDQTHWISTPGTIAIAPGTSTSQEAWFRTVNSQGVICGFGSTQTGASTNKTNLLTITSTGRVAFLVKGTSNYELTTSYSLNDGAWHHVVGVHNASTGLFLYVDGVLRASNSSGHPSALTAYFRIGYENTNGFTNGFGSDQDLAHFWDYLAFISFYPFAMTSTQVSQHYSLAA
ncbi:LamG-like jellyroll fold domain-containing protein [Actinokineospora cianjurensis]|uniref:Concanavalin A-like lectin/glucanase superfamily protein n=1 Tax=Actinokineospora cianjurensis TaxID=585224 RepID=A0A421AYJ5_9PSEU|nr:LamG-like jellyroll fold domain-containing protein [Actinokineospora cianjurensis]RLK54890.1 concanavalin A-like lectin/glucanase superfamily protein [Actinokineospora cianjurensis]